MERTKFVKCLLNIIGDDSQPIPTVGAKENWRIEASPITSSSVDLLAVDLDVDLVVNLNKVIRLRPAGECPTAASTRRVSATNGQGASSANQRAAKETQGISPRRTVGDRSRDGIK